MANSGPDKPDGQLLRAAGAMGAATFISRITGLVREQAFAILFGAGDATDAFTVAFRIPNLLRNLFAEGALSASLVPTFTRTRIEEGDRRAWRVAGLVFRVLFVVVAAISALGVLLAPQLVGLYASAFQAVPGKLELTVRMTRLLFPFFPLVALAAAFMGVLNACGLFFLPAFASALFNVASVVVGVGLVFILKRSDLGLHPIEGMAIGVLAGGLVQALCQVPSLYRAGYRWYRREPSEPLWSRDPALRRMLAMMVPAVVGLAATQINILVNTVLATSLERGAVSYLGFAFRLMQFPIGIFGVSLASAALPRLSAQWASREPAAAAVTLERGLKTVFAVNLPASAGLAFLGVPIVSLIFQYGRFTAESVHATALALAMYAVGLTAYSAVKMLVRACYAFGNTRVTVVSSLLSMILNVIVNLILIGPLGFCGLALGTSIAAVFNFLILLVAARRLLKDAGSDLDLASLGRSFASQLGVALVMGGVCWATHRGLQALLPDASWDASGVPFLGRSSIPLIRAGKIGLLLIEGLLVVVMLARLLGLPESTEAVDLFSNRIKKKLRRRKT